MALFTKEDKTQRVEDDVKSAAVTPAPPVDTSAAREVQANLGKGSRVEGKLSFEGSVRIDGQVEGDISAQDTVIIGKNAEVTAQIHAGTVVVEGRVNGDITARQRVELRSPAKLVGNLSTPSLIIHEGALFEGSCTMGDESRVERGDKKIAIFPKEERGGAARRPSEAAS
jgi:cytoskeletal protein CcmA (bactofilin family)